MSRCARAASPIAAAYHALLSEERDGSIEWNELLEGVLNHETSFFRHPAVVRCPAQHHSAGPAQPARAGRVPQFLERRLLDRAGDVLPGDAGDGRRGDCRPLHRVGQRCQPPRDRRRPTRPLRPADAGRPHPGVPPALPPRGPGRSRRRVRDRAELRERVRFIGINLFSASDFSPRHDVIFCHNVLIYFAPEAVPRGSSTRSPRVFVPGGYLLLGPGEGPGRSPPGLEPLHVPGVRGVPPYTPGRYGAAVMTRQLEESPIGAFAAELATTLPSIDAALEAVEQSPERSRCRARGIPSLSRGQGRRVDGGPGRARLPLEPRRGAARPGHAAQGRSPRRSGRCAPPCRDLPRTWTRASPDDPSVPIAAGALPESPRLRPQHRPARRRDVDGAARDRHA